MRLGRLAASLILALTGMAVLGGPHAIAHSHLVALRRERTPPMPWPGGPSYKHSAVVTSYEDLGYDPRPFLWEVAIWYSHCPLTWAGAFRLTLFANGRQYAHTLVDFRASDRAAYTWSGRQETTWTYHVQIPVAHGCAYWKLGTVGN